MKKVVMGAALLALLGSPAVAQTSATGSSQPLPPGFANPPEAKWGASDLPPGLSNEKTKRDWVTPPGWSNQRSQGWQDGNSPSATGGGPSAMSSGGPNAMSGGGGRGRGR
jgi:hypothetical protein